uniref:Uncharacterized protein n=1 Tax=Rhizophora mucronata TaxID=61149 RepID=A0A2P2QLD5_RHIMU
MISDLEHLLYFMFSISNLNHEKVKTK